jgi:hypothetical protein
MGCRIRCLCQEAVKPAPKSPKNSTNVNAPSPAGGARRKPGSSLGSVRHLGRSRCPQDIFSREPPGPFGSLPSSAPFCSPSRAAFDSPSPPGRGFRRYRSVSDLHRIHYPALHHRLPSAGGPRPDCGLRTLSSGRIHLVVFAFAMVCTAIVNLAFGIRGPHDELAKNRPKRYVRLASYFSPVERHRPLLNPSFTFDFNGPLPAGVANCSLSITPPTAAFPPRQGGMASSGLHRKQRPALWQRICPTPALLLKTSAFATARARLRSVSVAQWCWNSRCRA